MRGATAAGEEESVAVDMTDFLSARGEVPRAAYIRQRPPWAACPGMRLELERIY
jgi:hypothetical protein